eukprot:scaffold7025_cov225-Skeletonema_marinoi.AAC.2
MEMEATWRRSTVETVLRCGLVIVNAFGRPLVSGFQSYFYFDCIDTDFRTGRGLSKEKPERCGHPDAASCRVLDQSSLVESNGPGPRPYVLNTLQAMQRRLYSTRTLSLCI